MQKFVVLVVVAALGWAWFLFQTVTRVPTVEVIAAAACASDAEAWGARLEAHGFAVARVTAEVTPCLRGRAAGFDLAGAVPPEAVERLIRKRPRGISGLAMAGTEVMTLNRDGTRSAFTAEPKKADGHG